MSCPSCSGPLGDGDRAHYGRCARCAGHHPGLRPTRPPATTWDERINLAGCAIGDRIYWQRRHAQVARRMLATAAFYRVIGDRPQAAFYLALASRARRSFTNAITPVPGPNPVPGHAWMPALGSWLPTS